MEVIKVCLKYSTGFINFVSIALSVIIVISISFGLETVQTKIMQNSENVKMSTNEIDIKVNNNKSYINFIIISLKLKIQSSTSRKAT